MSGLHEFHGDIEIPRWVPFYRLMEKAGIKSGDAVTLRVELRDRQEVVLIVDGEERYRGPDLIVDADQFIRYAGGKPETDWASCDVNKA